MPEPTPTAAARTDGGRGDFSERIVAHRRELLAHCARMVRSPRDSEDLVQETLLRAWRSREGFEGRDGASLRRWLYRIATNVCIDAQRGRHRRLAAVPDVAGAGELDWHEILPSPDPGPEERTAARETIERALEAAQRLPPRQRTVLIMRAVVGLSARETAALLGSSVPAVNSLLQRARAGFRARLAEEVPV